MANISILRQYHPFQSNTYLISDGVFSAVVDPSTPYDKNEIKGVVKYILLTHSHFDHMLEIDSWVRETGAEVIVSEQEITALSDPTRNCFRLFDGSDRGYLGPATGVSDGDSIKIGNISMSVISCPGHTIGSLCYYFEGNAFVGDTLFAGGGYGRTDLPTGNFVLLKDSINRILSLPDDTVLYCGHGPRTTVKEYKLDTGR